MSSLPWLPGSHSMLADTVVAHLCRHFEGMQLGFTVDAKVLHDLTEATVPFSLWCHHEIRSAYDELEDYVRLRGQDGGLTYHLTTETAQAVALRQPTRIGTAYRMRMIAAMKAYRGLPGNEDLETFEGVMRAVDRHAEDAQRLRQLFDEG